jgi:mono/diheme cytochrome c family protein
MHFMKREFLALTLVALLALVFPASLFAYQAWRTHSTDARVIEIAGSQPDNGGWVPDVIRVNAGERVRLRISSPDVVHGFEIPALGVRVDEILPGHVEEVEFVAAQAGRYPFACTRWCSADHWRMRGFIEVVDPGQSDPPEATFAPPLYQQLKIDLDAMHPAENIPGVRPSAPRGAKLGLTLQADFRTRSFSQVFGELRANAAYAAYTDMDLWDAIAHAYVGEVGDETFARGARLYARDCAACHGERGDGTGPAGRELPGLTVMHPDMPRGPANFADPAAMLGASDALLQGKILRGGMGTGMPEWGSLYDDKQMWDVVAFLRSFTLETGIKSQP